MGPVVSIEAVITLAPKENRTQLGIESQSKLAGVPKFAEGFVARMSKKESESNFGNAKLYWRRANTACTGWRKFGIFEHFAQWGFEFCQPPNLVNIYSRG